MSSKYRDEVFAIGALGGSGTRAVAQWMLEESFYLGDELNAAKDNLVFTAIFKNPTLLVNFHSKDIASRIGVFEKYMRTGSLTKSDIKKIEWYPGQERTGHPQGRREYPTYLLYQLVEQKDTEGTRTQWGWKEPNTHIFLEPLARYFPKFKYIHIIRHGLDMAFAKNKKQLFNWGHLYGINAKPTESDVDLAVKQLDYWIRSTQKTLDIGKKLLGNHFYLLRYEEICNNTRPEADKLLNFLQVEKTKSATKPEDIFTLSEAAGRYKMQDLSIFRQDQLEAVQQLGYEL